MVQDVGLDDAVEEVAADEAEVAVDGGGGAADVVPAAGLVVGEGGVGVLEVGDCDCGVLVCVFSVSYTHLTLPTICSV